MNYDIAIIGGGPAGYTAAERAAEGGLKTVLFEKNAIGGVCLNEGCIPTKTLLYSAKILDSFKTSSKYGISPEGTPSFDMDKIIRRKNRTVKKLTSGVKMRLTSSGITIVEGTAILNGETDGMIRIQCGNALFTVKNVLLCTGSETVIPPIKGLSDTDYWTSREALDSKELPKELAIIGGGVIGIEFASFFTSMGVKVKVIEMMPEILGAMDKEASAMLRSEYAKKGVEFHLNTKVPEVNPKEVIVEKDGKTNAIPADKILVSVGRRAITKNLGLESLSIETDRRGVRVNEYMQTSDPDIYAGGDCVAIPNLVTGTPIVLALGSLANRQGRVIGTNAASASGKAAAFHGAVGTWCVKLFKMSACGTGLTIERAKAFGFDAVSASLEQLDRAHFYPE